MKEKQTQQDMSLDRIGTLSGADTGFLERGFICIKLWGVRFADLSHFS